MAGRRLSQRRGMAGPDGPYEGVPQHLANGLLRWFNETMRPYQHRQINERKLLEIAGFMRAPVEPDWPPDTVMQHLVALAKEDDDYFLDLIDATLQYVGTKNNSPRLAALLDAAGSVWTVSEDHDALVGVVTDEIHATFEAATSVADEITKEMKEAWSNAFGRDGDPSDAWGHAITALEDLLIPVVVPNQTKANLGHVVGQLRNQGTAWKLVLPGKDQDHDVAPLVGMLNVIWPNHDRHGGGQTPKRTPSPQEARAVVTLAATLVQWHREGWVVQKR